MDKEAWRFINTFAPWFSAIGTLIAATTAIYLARLNRRIRLKVSANRMFLIIDSEGRTYAASPEFLEMNAMGRPSKPGIRILVTNHGYRKAVITNVYFCHGFSKKKYVAPIAPAGVSLPVTLEEGQDQDFVFPEDVLITQQKERWQKVFSSWRHPSMESLFFKVGVVTSTGKHFRSRVSRKLLNYMQLAMNE